MTDLTERLRDGICYTALGTLDDEMTDNLMYEAAATLETLTQENARLREAGWRDIESAPRDGRDALVGCWVINYDEPEKPPVWSAWETVFDGGPLGCDGTWGDEPTHWHDMPAPPPLPARKSLGGGDEQ